MEKEILRIINILIMLAGFYIFIKPAVVAAKIKLFYSNYPIIRYSGEKQLTSRLGFIRCTGITMIIVGLLGLVSR